MDKTKTYCVLVESTARLGPDALLIEAKDGTSAAIKAIKFTEDVAHRIGPAPWKTKVISVSEAVPVEVDEE